MSAFHFHTKLEQTLLLGKTARTAVELLRFMEKVPESSIYYHTHRFLQQHHYLSPEPPNDFAYWTREVLNETRLGEALSSVDVVQLGSLRELRESFIRILEAHVQDHPSSSVAPEGQEFHFMSSRAFVLPTPYLAHTLEEFQELLRLVSISSLYYHMFDAKLRLERGENDFSRWFRDLGKTELADGLARLDPYTYTLEGLRTTILRLVERYGKDT